MSTINQDIPKGAIGEQLVIDLYNRCGFNSILVSPTISERKYWDISTNGHGLNFKTEVKYDIYEKKSGNLAIEVFNTRQNQPSGITITKANIWAHVLYDSIFLTSTALLKEFVETAKPLKIIEKAGDGNAMLLLYPRHHILPAIFIDMNTLSDEQVIENLRNLLCILK